MNIKTDMSGQNLDSDLLPQRLGFDSDSTETQKLNGFTYFFLQLYRPAAAILSKYIKKNTVLVDH